MSVSTFIPELWNARLLSALEKSHIATNFVNRDYEGEIKNAGDTVHINTISNVTIKSYDPSQPLEVETLTTTDKTLEINQQYYFNFTVDDIDATQASGDLIDKATSTASYGLADTSDKYIFSTLASGASNVLGTDASPLSVDADNVYDCIVSLRALLDKANVPTFGRKLAVNPEIYSILLRDTKHFAVANQATTGDNAVVNGSVGRIGGFDIFETNNLPLTGDSSDVFNIIATVPTACTFAEQIIKTETYRVEKGFGDGVKGLNVFGCKVTDGSQIAVLKCKLS